MTVPAISYRGVCKIYEKSHLGRVTRTTGLDGLDLDIEKSEIYGILGLNGAGKTTAMLGNTFHIPLWVVLSCQAAIALGTFFGGWRIVKTMCGWKCPACPASPMCFCALWSVTRGAVYPPTS